MRQIKIKKITDAFSRGSSHLSQPAHDVPVYLSHRRAFNPTSLLVTVSLICSIGGFLTGKRELFILAFSLLGLYILLYARTKRIVRGLHFRRKIAARGNANDEIVITLDVINTSPFPVNELFVTENFLGTISPPDEFYIPEIKPFSNHRLNYKARLDAGSGFFGFDPVKAVVTDSLGLTEAELTDSTLTNEIQVFPKVHYLPELPLSGSRNSIHWGLFDVQAPSVSVNFMGVRDYVTGDPLKHISWRISARNQNLVVKEFEKSVNVEITVLLDMESRKHAGLKSDSTWEVVKDLGLGLIAQQIAKGNSIQVLSQNFYLPSGRGEAQSNFAVLSIGQLKPVHSEVPLLKSALPLISKTSVIFYITPCFIYNFHDEELELLKKLKTEGYEIYVFLIEPNSFIRTQVHSINNMLLAVNDRALLEKVDSKVIKELAKNQIHAYWISKERGIANSLLNERVTEKLS